MIDEEFHEIVMLTQKNLGLNDYQFSSILGISTATLLSWKYKKIVPSLLYQDLVFRLWRRSEILGNYIKYNFGNILHAIAEFEKIKDDKQNFYKEGSIVALRLLEIATRIEKISTYAKKFDVEMTTENQITGV